VVHNWFCELRHTLGQVDIYQKEGGIHLSTQDRKKFVNYLIILGLFLATAVYLAFSPLFPG